MQLNKLLVERALAAELTEHLVHKRNEAVPNVSNNRRNRITISTCLALIRAPLGPPMLPLALEAKCQMKVGAR